MEIVHVELEWYDGPRRGVANFNGAPHRFISQYREYKGDFDVDQERDVFDVFPISRSDLKLEQEQWKIFVDWNSKFEAGELPAASHPGKGGINSRWDEIETLLVSSRDVIPKNTLEAYAVFTYIENRLRYSVTGPSYRVNWELLNEAV